MITHIYICNRCEGDLEGRTFEKEYSSYREAENSATPRCPRCDSSDFVTRFFGHNIFSKMRNRGLPSHYVPYRSHHRTGIISVGINITEEQKERLEEKIEKMLDRGEIIAMEGEDGKDVPTEEVLGLKEGTVDHALFKIRERKMIDDLMAGEPVSGFFLPICGEWDN
ncbi:MAG: hypothetical protein AB1546_10185 [bacterium]